MRIHLKILHDLRYVKSQLAVLRKAYIGESDSIDTPGVYLFRNSFTDPHLLSETLSYPMRTRSRQTTTTIFINNGQVSKYTFIREKVENLVTEPTRLRSLTLLFFYVMLRWTPAGG